MDSTNQTVPKSRKMTKNVKMGDSHSAIVGNYYCVEHYDERFDGEEAESIVEICIPIEKK